MNGHNTQLRLAGSGGQGIILSSVILAEAAVLEGKYAAQSQSYGPEARGGLCRAEVIVSETPIDFPKVTHTDFLLALTQAALEKYSVQTDENSIILADADLEPPRCGVRGKLLMAPIIRTARELLKKPIATNIVAVSVVNGCLGLVYQEALEEATLKRVPRGMEDLNRWALIEGNRLAANLK